MVEGEAALEAIAKTYMTDPAFAVYREDETLWNSINDERGAPSEFHQIT
jgi:hypothetical protein